jgi:hypothetical protein
MSHSAWAGTLSNNKNKLTKQAKRPIDKNLGELDKRPIDKNLGELDKRPIDKNLGELDKRPINKNLELHASARIPRSFSPQQASPFAQASRALTPLQCAEREGRCKAEPGTRNEG